MVNSVPLVTLTPKAAQLVTKLLEKEGIKPPPGGMRFGIKAGGCSGYEYFNRPEKKDSDSDHIIISRGARILIDRASMKIMQGTTIDHTDNLLDPQFIFTNPNAKSTCGCGISFELK